MCTNQDIPVNFASKRFHSAGTPNKEKLFFSASSLSFHQFPRNSDRKHYINEPKRTQECQTECEEKKSTIA